MTFEYKPQGVCSRNLTFDIENGIIKNVKFQGGCHGNLQGIAALCEGKPAEEIINSVVEKCEAELDYYDIVNERTEEIDFGLIVEFIMDYIFSVWEDGKPL